MVCDGKISISKLLLHRDLLRRLLQWLILCRGIPCREIFYAVTALAIIAAEDRGTKTNDKGEEEGRGNTKEAEEEAKEFDCEEEEELI